MCHPFDLAGAALLSVGLIGITGLLTHGPKSDPALAPMLGVALAVLAVTLLRRELRHPDLVVQPRLFGRRAFRQLRSRPLARGRRESPQGSSRQADI